MRKKSAHFSLTKAFFIFLATLCTIIIIGLIYFASFFGPVNSSISEDISFAIPKGQAISIIGSRLKDKGLIKNNLAFKIFVKTNNLDNKIQAGSFTLNPNMSLNKVINILTTGTEDNWVTLQEGWRKEEIAESMVRQNFEYFDEEFSLSSSIKVKDAIPPLVTPVTSPKFVYAIFPEVFVIS